MNAEYNKKLVEDMYVALNAKDLDAHNKYWHEDDLARPSRFW
jgi:hypothetical protein